MRISWMPWLTMPRSFDIFFTVILELARGSKCRKATTPPLKRTKSSMAHIFSVKFWDVRQRHVVMTSFSADLILLFQSDRMPRIRTLKAV